MKRTQPGKILRPGFLQLDVVADDADDIGLLLYRVFEIVSGHVEVVEFAGDKLHLGLWAIGAADGNIAAACSCGKTVE